MTRELPWRALVLALWIIASVVLLAVMAPALAERRMSDPDDYMRLVQVRDWLAGQGWFDVTQHRMDPPRGGAMHWSRLVDLPLAGVILLLRPLVGTGAAEIVAVAIVPLVTLGLLLLLGALIVRRLRPEAVAPALGALFVLCSGYVLVQTYPTRIDHHGWQIACSAAAVLALLDSRPVRGGVMAGLAIALGLNISMEGLLFAVAVGALLGCRAMSDAAHLPRLVAFSAALAGAGTGLALLLQGPGLWPVVWCDVPTLGHLAAFAVAAVGTGGVLLAGQRLSTPARIMLLAAVAAAAAASFALVAPRCLASPFAQMNPTTYTVWYLNVMEGHPVWRQSPANAVTTLGFPLVGLSGAWWAWRRAATSEERRNWFTLLLLAAAALAVAVMVRRAAGLAQLLAVPGAVVLALALGARAGRIEKPARRVLARVSLFVAVSPLLPAYVAALVSSAERRDERTPADPACDATCSLGALAALPPTDLLASLDVGPAVLAFTRHRVIAGGYHRNHEAIAEVIQAFTGPEGRAVETIRRRRIRYVLIDPKGGEAGLFARRAPDGLMARLSAGRPPAWLTPDPALRGRYRLFRVLPERLPEA